MKGTKLTVFPLAFAGCALLGSASLQAATVVYNFDQGGLAGWTLPDPGTQATITAAAASNDFGSGVTASVYSFTGGGTVAGAGSDRQIGFVGGEARAMLNNNAEGIETHVFTLTIDASVTVDLTNMAWDSGTVFAEHSWDLDIVAGSGETFSTSGAPWNTTEGGTLRTANNSEALTGLTGLTNTTVTVTITDNTGRNNNSTDLYSFVDNVVLTGTATAVPEPSVPLMLLGFGGLAVLRRRRA